jgi:hypothetical protein
MKMMSGAAVAEPEVKRLEKIFPTTADTPEAFNAKVDQWLEDVGRTVSASLEVQQAAGKNVDPLIAKLQEAGIAVTTKPKGGKYTGQKEAPPAVNYDIGTVGGKKYMFEKGTKKNLGEYKGQ